MAKKQISAEIIADSKNEFGDRITTFVLTFPRFILAELNTHRAFSRNSASSRAIPFKKMVKMVEEDPFIPIAWQKDHKGMQGTEYFSKKDELYPFFKTNWLEARDSAVESAQMQNELGLTKQLCNRILEPFMWHTAIVTATEFENFFKQRCPEYESWQYNDYGGMYCKMYRSRKDWINSRGYPNQTFLVPENGANRFNCLEGTDLDWLQVNKGQGEIHIMALAEKMWDAMNDSEPKSLKEGEWHIPFGDKFDEGKIDSLVDSLCPIQPASLNWNMETCNQIKRKISTARCARISYLNFESKDDYEVDIKLHDRLAKMHHWSPFEHCAQAMNDSRQYDKPKSRNFTGFVQYREIVENA